jgi:hypothetical protein
LGLQDIQAQDGGFNSLSVNALAVFSGAILDGSASPGAPGQIFSSTGAETLWVDPIAFYSGTFFDTTEQLNGGATTANQVRINSTQQAFGLSLGVDNRIDVLNSGVYFIGANLQLAFTGGASNYNVTVWYTVNDFIVPNSAFTFSTSSAQVDQTLAALSDTIVLSAGDYLKFYWWSPATGMKLLATSIGINPTRPASPSVNINIFNVGQA